MTVEWMTRSSVRLGDFTAGEIERRNIEIWDGEVVEKMSPAGKQHNLIAKRILFLFELLCQRKAGLFCSGDNDGFIIEPGGENFLCPDAALFVPRPSGKGPWHEFSPEIAVEVLSPEDRRASVLVKRDLYIKGGSQEVWILNPKDRSLEIHYRDGRCLRGTGRITPAEGLAAGLELELDAIFELPDFMTGGS